MTATRTLTNLQFAAYMQRRRAFDRNPLLVPEVKRAQFGQAYGADPKSLAEIFKEGLIKFPEDQALFFGTPYRKSDAIESFKLSGPDYKAKSMPLDSLTYAMEQTKKRTY